MVNAPGGTDVFSVNFEPYLPVLLVFCLLAQFFATATKDFQTLTATSATKVKSCNLFTILNEASTTTTISQLNNRFSAVLFVKISLCF